MGLLRLLVPRPVRRARRVARHPVRTAVRAATPRPVKQVRRTAFRLTHPIEAAEGMLVGALIRPKNHRARGASRRPRSASSASAVRVIEHDDAQEAIEEFIAFGLVHSDPTTPAERDVTPPVLPVDERDVRRRLRRDATANLRWWRVGERRAARRTVTRDAVAAEVANETRSREDRRAESQAEADAAWDQLLANEPERVGESIGKALTAGGSPAVLVSVDRRRLEVRTTVPDMDNVVPLREPTYTAGGRPTTRAFSMTNRNGLYRQLVGSQLLALLRCILAAAPGATRIELYAELPTGERIARGEFDRDALRSIPLDSEDPFADLLTAGLEVRQKGRTNALVPFA
jgi:hypothetical protein